MRHSLTPLFSFWRASRAALAAAGLTAALTPSASAASAPDEPALKDVFAGKFLIGAALSHGVVGREDHPARALIGRHFNTVTSGNAMKWGPYNPQPGEFRHQFVDAFLDLAEANEQHVLGHVLFWHQQTPAWVFAGEDGELASRETLLARMRTRVQELAARYGDRVDAWDVVNEAYLEDGSLRDSPFTKILGQDWIAEAFRIAQEELPSNVALLYNDYNMYEAGKRAAVVRLVHDLRARGLRIDALGMQGHWHLDHPSLADIEASIVAFRDAGVKVEITELDIEILPRTAEMYGADLNVGRRLTATTENNPYTEGLPEDMQQKLAARYAEVFALFLKHADVIERVTFWGVTDADSWLNNWPIRGRTNHPLPFDRQGRPKAAFQAIVDTARGH